MLSTPLDKFVDFSSGVVTRSRCKYEASQFVERVESSRVDTRNEHESRVEVESLLRSVYFAKTLLNLKFEKNQLIVFKNQFSNWKLIQVPSNENFF